MPCQGPLIPYHTIADVKCVIENLEKEHEKIIDISQYMSHDSVGIFSIQSILL